ncbi:unnamed protein product [Arctia plantaginis]|uniref:Ig-like domain-containing protein n=1 Tax=Arctia plantaginis TaxID=874455 RepID=A0A8S1AII7_ARCPL|nr:unnamed protein product [Arctia plantaginis]
MLNSLSLLVAILVSVQCTVAASALDRNVLDNNLQPNVVPTPRRRLGNVVRIKEAPPPTVKLEPGQRLVLTCEVMGRPLPSVQWLKNGEPAVDYEDDTNEILPVHPSSIAFLISKLVVTAASNGDVFTCVATSRGKQDTASTTVLTVEGNNEENFVTLQKLFRLPSKPIITTYLENIFQNMGTDVVLPCRVTGAAIWRPTCEKFAVVGHGQFQLRSQEYVWKRRCRYLRVPSQSRIKRFVPLLDQTCYPPKNLNVPTLSV